MAAKKTAAAAPKSAAPAPTAPVATETAAAPPADDQAAPPGEPTEAPPALEQSAEAPPIEVAKPEAAAPAPTASVPDLDDFIADHERAAQAVDLVVTAISHPAAKPRHHNGVYSGFPITTGELSATYSDGSVH